MWRSFAILTDLSSVALGAQLVVCDYQGQQAIRAKGEMEGTSPLCCRGEISFGGERRRRADGAPGGEEIRWSAAGHAARDAAGLPSPLFAKKCITRPTMSIVKAARRGYSNL